MSQPLFRLGLICLLLFISPVFLLAQTSQSNVDFKELDAYAQKAMQDWHLPGFAIAIVKDDKIVFTKGYGVRQFGEPTPVDEHTVFAIASCSKAFTAAALAMLVDEGKLKWDDPVTKYLPDFQLYDPYVTREITVRDLLCHRSGLATFGGDLLWYQTTYNRQEVLRRIRYLKPVSSFRSKYGYQNIMFLAAGQVVQVVTGKSWDEFVKERLFMPLGMTSTSTSIQTFKPGDNLATPHNELDGKLRVVKYLNSDNIAPAAGINSCVADLAQWLRLQLGQGKYQEKQIFSAAASREMWSPQTISPLSEQAEQLIPSRHFQLYGLGWGLSDYHGRKVVAHGGALDGMLSQIGIMPEEHLGVVILTNGETQLQVVLMRKVFDLYLGVPKRDWSADLLALTKAGELAKATEQKKIEDQRAKDTKPSLELAQYAGTYAGNLYGEAKVSEENGKLVVRLVPAPNFVGDLEHWHYDTFRITWRNSNYPFPKGFVTFVLTAQGKVGELKLDVPNPDFDFTELEFKRLPDAGSKVK